MNRRDFIKGLGTGIAVSYVSFRARRYFVRRHDKKFLSQNFNAFKTYAKEQKLSKDDLYKVLRDKGVVTFTGSVSPKTLSKLATTDKILEYDGYFYTETELQLYSMGYLNKF